MRKLVLLLFVALSLSSLLSKPLDYEDKLKEFNLEDVSFFFGNIMSTESDGPLFASVAEHEWLSKDFLKKHNLFRKGSFWIRLKIRNNMISFNSMYLNYVDKDVEVYYPKKIFPVSKFQENINMFNISQTNKGSFIPITWNGDFSNNQNNIYVKVNFTGKVPLFRLFPIVVGNETELHSFVREANLKKKKTDVGLFFIGNFLFFASIVSFLIFLFTIKKINVTLLLFSLLMATAGAFYWLISPISMFFTNFSHTHVLFTLISYHLIWLFFGLLISSFLHKRILLIMPALILISLLLFLLPSQMIKLLQPVLLTALVLYHLLIIYFIFKDKNSLFNSKILFTIAACVNIFYILHPIVFKNTSFHTVFGPVGIGLLFWVFSFGVFLFNQYSHTFNELQSQKIKNLELTELNLESQLSSLKRQLDPHFLFNSLGTVTALIETNPEVAVEFIEEFSSVYRYILDTNESKFVPLERELEFCKAYLFLLKKRFGENIIISIDVKDDRLKMHVPPLSVQMLIENTIKHNIITSQKKLSIEIYSTSSNMVAVKNNIQPKKSLERSSKVGLKNLNQQLFLLKKKNIIVTESPQYFTVEIPLIEEV